MHRLPRLGILAVAVVAAIPPGSRAEPGAGSGWSVTAGAQVRRIDVGFQVDAPAPISWSGLFSRRGNSGPGDVGVATSGSDFITYLDGTVGINRHPIRDRDTSFTVASLSQVEYGIPQAPGFDFNSAGHVTFHSGGTTYEYAKHYRPSPFSVDDSAVVVSPLVELQRTLFQDDEFFVDLVVGWSWLESEHATGTRTVATQSLVETKTNSRYTYVYDFPTSSAGVPAGFPPTFDNSSGATGLIYDAADYNAFGGFGPGDVEYVRNPRTFGSHGSMDRVIAVISAESSAALEVDAHVIPILLEARRQLNPRLFLSVSAGPTLNVISHDLESRTDWYLNGSHLASQRDSDSGTDLVVGASVRGTLSYVLSDDGTFLFETGGGYDWVPTQTASAGNARAEFDLSSWIGTLGFCKHF
ncbi:MAG: hypothetical protein KDM91_19795 [Verrucomicrobiae bacterium]|nr:hypothetical protein [Verrucomicrobiae bacterium]MCP5540328.1 hypothetical protein [Akkermansiaceae bacterium]MCP5550706.1 hypothetical protein [Akkermansiaceae bacterium]